MQKEHGSVDVAQAHFVKGSHKYKGLQNMHGHISNRRDERAVYKSKSRMRKTDVAGGCCS
jgi:hypothetical protein